MLGICRWEYTINETYIGHFLCKYCIYNKIKIKLPLLKNYIVLLKKNRTSSVFARIKTKTVLESLKVFLLNVRIFFSHFLYSFLLTRDFRWVTERIQSPIQNIQSIENEKENGKTFCRKSFKDSKTVFVSILS